MWPWFSHCTSVSGKPRSRILASTPWSAASNSENESVSVTVFRGFDQDLGDAESVLGAVITALWSDKHFNMFDMFDQFVMAWDAGTGWFRYF